MRNSLLEKSEILNATFRTTDANFKLSVLTASEKEEEGKITRFFVPLSFSN